MAWTLECEESALESHAAARLAGDTSDAEIVRGPSSETSGLSEVSTQRLHANNPVVVRKAGMLVPPKGGLNPKQNKGFNTSDGERRTMALCAFVPSSGPSAVAVVSAASDATVRLSVLQLVSAAWRPAALLVHHTRPVLSMAHVVLSGESTLCEHGHDPVDDNAKRGDSDRRAQPGAALDVVLTGATDGSVAMWDMTSAAYRGSSCDSSGTRAGTAVQAAPLPSLQPVWHAACHHQSGVNAMAAVATSTGVLVITGGDDQTLRSTLMERTKRGSVHCAATYAVPCAHTSAIKGVAACCVGSDADARVYACSVGLDQILRVWAVSVCGTVEGKADIDVALAEVMVRKLDVSEPACVHGSLKIVQRRRDGVDEDLLWHIVVAGRSTQTLSVKL